MGLRIVVLLGLWLAQAAHGRGDAMVAAAHPEAANAGAAILRAGGSAVDAAIAVQMVLTLVEPQSSGIGGGAFLVYWDAFEKQARAYDGRETAPSAARPDRFLGPDGRPEDFLSAMGSGRAVGVPGVLRLLELVHARHGRLPWAQLFAPAIRLAERGFAVSPRLHRLIAADPLLAKHPAARAYFFLPDGRPLPIGHRLRNPALAGALREIADRGADAFYRGPIARDIVDAVANHPSPGDLTQADLEAYRALERAPLCGPYRAWRICGMPAPSSGGIGVLAILGILAHQPIRETAPASARAVHLFSEAARLAYADRDRYVGDPAFVKVPEAGLVDPAYLASRALQIDPSRSMGRAEPGQPPGAPVTLGEDATVEAAGTSHLSILDHDGHAVAMTSSVEAAFGSRIFVRGFLLNNQLTDFSFLPGSEGRPAANRVEAGKRPRSSMAPTVVLDAEGRLRYVLGSPGGSAILNYVAKTLVGALDWGLPLQQAIDAPNMGSRNRETEIERGTALGRAAATLRSMGHVVAEGDMVSGTYGIEVTPAGPAGGADPRREGRAVRVPARVPAPR